MLVASLSPGTIASEDEDYVADDIEDTDDTDDTNMTDDTDDSDDMDTDAQVIS